ncbi:C6 transcription factor [Colletotrichum tabaci]|uniref:C6 transcription factor n=1 Tax=Colletotrichum tabaci TaxID=1209068 RepID=A0AAV9TXG7_9PEZI
MSKHLPPHPGDEDSPLLPRNLLLSDDGPTVSNLVLFRRAVGINAGSGPHDDSDTETGRAAALGIYAEAIAAYRRARTLRILATVVVYACHAAQLLTGAALTSMGPSAGVHRFGITALGGANTVVAGVLAWMKGRGVPDGMRADEVGFRRLRDWIEETEALVALGAVGGTRDEIGELVAEAFRRWHVANDGGRDERSGEYLREENVGGSKGKGLTARWLRGW